MKKIDLNSLRMFKSLNSNDALTLLQYDAEEFREAMLNIIIQNSNVALNAISNGVITDKKERLFILKNITIVQLFKFLEYNNVLLPDEHKLIFERCLENSNDAARLLKLSQDLTDYEIKKLVKVIVKYPSDVFFIYSNYLVEKLDSESRKLVRKCLNNADLANKFLALDLDLKEEKEEAINTLLKTASNSLILIQKYNHLLTPEQHKQAMIKIAFTKTVLAKLILDKRYYVEGGILKKTYKSENTYKLSLIDKKVIVDTIVKFQKVDLCMLIYDNIQLPKYLKEKLEPFVLLNKLSK